MAYMDQKICFVATRKSNYLEDEGNNDDIMQKLIQCRHLVPSTDGGRRIQLTTTPIRVIYR